MIEKKFAQEKNKIRENLSKVAGVRGVGLGQKVANGKRGEEMSVRVYVKRKHSKADLSGDKMIPATVTMEDGTVLRTDVVEIGDVKFLGFTGRYRPAQPGAVLSHYASEYAGTFGALATDNTDGRSVILSASHILSNFNNGVVGDNILQPSAQYGGANPADAIAKLKRFIPLNTDLGGTNYVDAGIAAPNATNLVKSTPFASPIKPTKQGAVGLLFAGSPDITIINPIGHVLSSLNITLPKTKTATVGMSIHKCGAASAYTTATVYDILVDLMLVAPNGNDVWFLDQIITAGGVSDSMAGDSGSIWYTTFNV